MSSSPYRYAMLCLINRLRASPTFPVLSKSGFIFVSGCECKFCSKMSFCRGNLSFLRFGLFQIPTANRVIPRGATVIRCMSAGTTEKIRHAQMGRRR